MDRTIKTKYGFVGKRLNFLSILIKFKLNQYANAKNEQVNENRFFCT